MLVDGQPGGVILRAINTEDMMLSLPMTHSATPDRRAGLTTLIARVVEWHDRLRGRQALDALDERMRKDIGVSADEALREAKKQFWIP